MQLPEGFRGHIRVPEPRMKNCCMTLVSYCPLLNLADRIPRKKRTDGGVV